MGTCEHCGRDGVELTLFRSLCEDCADQEYHRLRWWFEVGNAPIVDVENLDDFLLGALFARYGKSGVFGFGPWFVRPIMDGLPEQYVGVAGLGGIHWKGPTRRAGFDCEFAVEIKQSIPAELLRKTVRRCAEWPDRKQP